MKIMKIIDDYSVYYFRLKDIVCTKEYAGVFTVTLINGKEFNFCINESNKTDIDFIINYLLNDKNI